jgi:hypothetical protein
LTNNLNIENKLKIEYIMVLTEPEYDIYNLYPETIDNNYCRMMKEMYLLKIYIMAELLMLIYLLIKI